MKVKKVDPWMNSAIGNMKIL